MKRNLLLLIAMMLSAISFADSHLTVEPLNIRKGRQAQLTINYGFDEGHTICNYQMEVQLPDGISVVGTDVTLGECHSGHTGSIVNNVAVVTSMNSVINGTSGMLLKVTVEADPNLLVGTQLQGKLHNVKLGQLDETSINLDDISFDIEIVEDVLILDEEASDAPESEGNANVRVRRTIKADEWSTICLPFAMTAEQVTAAFGEGVQIMEFKGWKVTAFDDDDNTTAIEVSFSNVDAIEANTPYIIKVSNAISEFVVDGVDIDADDEPTVTVGKMNRGTFGSFTGSYVPTTIDEECLFLSENKFWYSVGNTTMKGFRAYFYFQEVLADYYAGNSGARVLFSFDDDKTTGVALMDNGQLLIDNSVYDLQGRRISVSSASSVNSVLPKGVYIVNGKKRVVSSSRQIEK